MIHDSAENVFFDFYFREKSYSNSFPYTVDFDSSFYTAFKTLLVLDVNVIISSIYIKWAM